MGQTLVAAILSQQDMTLAAALEVAGSPLLGHDAGGPLGQVTGVVVGSELAVALRAARFVAAQRAAKAPGLYDMRDVLGLD